MAFHVRVDGLVSELKAAATAVGLLTIFVDIDTVTADVAVNAARGHAGGHFFVLLCRRDEREIALQPWLVGLTEVEVSDFNAGTSAEAGGGSVNEDGGELGGLFD